MAEITKLQRTIGGVVFTYEALQYGGPRLVWHRDSLTQIAKFVLGMDPDTGVTAMNEHILDVVRPVMSNWKPDAFIADIDVWDPISGMKFRMSLGDWVLKSDDGNVIFVKADSIEDVYKPVPVVVRRQTEREQLTDVIYVSMLWEGKAAHILAERAADAILEAGWSRREKP